jgi:site-specific recombinase XerD
MTALAPTLQAFFTVRLAQRQASPNTVSAYRDTFKLLLIFASDRTGNSPSQLDIGQLDAPLIGEFLDHLQRERANGPRTRNARLAAIRSLFRFAAVLHPENAAVIQRVLAIPPRRTDRPLISYLTEPEIAALLAAPDRGTWTGRRDHALLSLAIQTGLRASELTALTTDDVHLERPAFVNAHGKGRKERITPLTRATTAILRVWRSERGGTTHDSFFPTRQGTRLSRDALERRLAKHAATASGTEPSLVDKKVTMHVLRHSAAMRLLHAGIDTTVIALWLGHESTETTQIYLHSDLAIKERALDRANPPGTPPGRYKPPDSTLAFLAGL